MDMLNILKNFDDAASGKKVGVAGQSKNEMKAILESLQAVEECGMPMASSSGDQPVTVNITASGKENVADLIAMMQHAAGIQTHSEVPASSQQDMDMHMMRQIMSDPEPEEIEVEPEEEEVEEWDNSPEEEYQDHNYMTKTLSGGINRQKKAYAKAQDGDNAMAVESIKDRLWAALNEKKATEGKYKSDAQRKAIHANKMKMKKK